MPATLFLGHVLAAVAIIAVLASIGFTISAVRHRGFGRGTPQYARARTARRSALYALVIALLFGAACLTPLCDVALLGSAA